MSRQFSPQTFFRCVTPYALQDFFGHLKLPMNVRWGEVNRNNIDPVERAYSQLTPVERKKAEKEMRAIFSLATSQGSECLAEAARHMNYKAYRKEIPTDATEYERAVWCWQYLRKVFNAALRFQSIDNLNWWRKRNDLPKQDPDLSPGALEGLKADIIAYLVSEQGRGQQCTINVVERGETTYLFAYPDDFLTKYESHDKNGKLRMRRIRPIFTVGFAFTPSEGTLEVCVKGNAALKERFEKAFARELLAFELVTWKKFVNYELDHLKDSNTRLETDPADHIHAKIRKLRLKCYGSRRLITLQIDDSDDHDSIHSMIVDMLHPDQVTMEDLIVDQATIRFEFLQHPGRKTGKISVEIGYPNSCNFRNTHQEWEDLIRKYLGQWRITRAQCADNDPEAVGRETTVSVW